MARSAIVVFMKWISTGAIFTACNLYLDLCFLLLIRRICSMSCSRSSVCMYLDAVLGMARREEVRLKESSDVVCMMAKERKKERKKNLALGGEPSVTPMHICRHSTPASRDQDSHLDPGEASFSGVKSRVILNRPRLAIKITSFG
jgi:hypothetical protein